MLNTLPVGSASLAWAQPAVSQEILGLPSPGTMVFQTAEFAPINLVGVRVFSEQPFRFDFLVDEGKAAGASLDVKKETVKLVKYFLASLTIPEEDLWVNLSPYEKDRITSSSLGMTEMGRDMLAQDYLLKQLTASLVYPEGKVGQEFWQKVYKVAQEKFGTTQVPVNAFNKVWIVPDKAEVLQQDNTALVVYSRLKVMLEEDYLAREGQQKPIAKKTALVDDQSANSVSSQIIREVVVPILEKEVNEGEHFVLLRQMYHSLVLATWYKRNLKESFLTKAYVDQAKIKGVDVDDPAVKERIYQQYLQAYQKGVYNYIKEDVDPTTGQMTPRKYFSGGVTFGRGSDEAILIEDRPEDLSPRGAAGYEAMGAEDASLDVVPVMVTDSGSAAAGAEEVLARTRTEERAADTDMGRIPGGAGTINTLLGAIFVAGVAAPLASARAVEPETVQAFVVDNRQHGYSTLSDGATGGTVSLVDVRSAGLVMDRNLDEMLVAFMGGNSGLIPSGAQMPQLRAIFDQSFTTLPEHFNDVTARIKVELTVRYAQLDSGTMSADDQTRLAQLEREVVDWVFAFLLANTVHADVVYDAIKASPKIRESQLIKDMSWRRLIVGNEDLHANDGSNRVLRTNVCKSFAQVGVVISQNEAGLREGRLSVVPVYELDNGTKVGKIGHVATLFRPTVGSPILLDQRGVVNVPTGEVRRELYVAHHPRIGMRDPDGNSRDDVDGRNLDQYPGYRGEGPQNFGEGAKFNQWVDRFNAVNSQATVDVNQGNPDGEGLKGLKQLLADLKEARPKFQKQAVKDEIDQMIGDLEKDIPQKGIKAKYNALVAGFGNVVSASDQKTTMANLVRDAEALLAEAEKVQSPLKPSIENFLEQLRSMKGAVDGGGTIKSRAALSDNSNMSAEQRAAADRYNVLILKINDTVRAARSDADAGKPEGQGLKDLAQLLKDFKALQGQPAPAALKPVLEKTTRGLENNFQTLEAGARYNALVRRAKAASEVFNGGNQDLSEFRAIQTELGALLKNPGVGEPLRPHVESLKVEVEKILKAAGEQGFWLEKSEPDTRLALLDPNGAASPILRQAVVQVLADPAAIRVNQAEAARRKESEWDAQLRAWITEHDQLRDETEQDMNRIIKDGRAVGMKDAQLQPALQEKAINFVLERKKVFKSRVDAWLEDLKKTILEDPVLAESAAYYYGRVFAFNHIVLAGGFRSDERVYKEDELLPSLKGKYGKEDQALKKQFHHVATVADGGLWLFWLKRFHLGDKAPEFQDKQELRRYMDLLKSARAELRTIYAKAGSQEDKLYRIRITLYGQRPWVWEDRLHTANKVIMDDVGNRAATYQKYRQDGHRSYISILMFFLDEAIAEGEKMLGSSPQPEILPPGPIRIPLLLDPTQTKPFSLPPASMTFRVTTTSAGGIAKTADVDVPVAPELANALGSETVALEGLVGPVRVRGRATHPIATATNPVGGIDFDPKDMKLNIHGTTMHFPVPTIEMDPAKLQGLFPVILNVVPLPNLQSFINPAVPEIQHAKAG
ncbi:MAG: hypothetical protein NUV91_03150 [Candidatus Omnitrophica bacterium]|nr:hypothetical protein [Candidatus Omnitrophota bacterium]